MNTQYQLQKAECLTFYPTFNGGREEHHNVSGPLVCGIKNAPCSEAICPLKVDMPSLLIRIALIEKSRRRGDDFPLSVRELSALADAVRRMIELEHDTRRLENRAAVLRSALVVLVGVDGAEELNAMESMLRLIPETNVDKADIINAIRALRDTL